MTFRIEDIAPLEGRRPTGATKVRRRGDAQASIIDLSTTRRRFVKGLVGGAVGLGFASLRLFPLTPPAWADGYDVWTSHTTGPCGAGNYAQDHQCSPGCGPSWVTGGYPNGCDNGSCLNCWHRCCGTYDPSGTINYFLRPNDCWTNSYDAWRWKCSDTVMFRCHDGWTCYTACAATICRVNVGV